MADPRVMGGGEGVENGDARAARREAFGFALSLNRCLVSVLAQCSGGAARRPQASPEGMGEEIARCRTPKGSGCGSGGTVLARPRVPFFAGSSASQEKSAELKGG